MFKHGQKVTLDDGQGKIVTGTLHLPDKLYYQTHVKPFKVPQTVTGQYGLYTIIKEDGSQFRTEGRLTSA